MSGKTAGRIGLPAVMAALVLAASLLNGCGVVKREAREGDRQVAVIIEADFKRELLPLLERSLEREILTPQPEKRFQLVAGNDDSLARFIRWQNVILAGALDSEDRVSQRLRKMLRGESLAGVEAGEYVIFKKDDLWALGQTVLFLVGAEGKQLVDWAGNNSNEIYSLLKQARDERMKEDLFGTLEQKKLADSLQSAHGWRLRIQHDYRLVASERSPNYIRLRRALPDRFITVAWRIGGGDELKADNLIAWHDRIGRTFADSIRINPVWKKISRCEIDGRPALKMNGLWESYGSLGGGPMVGYLLQGRDTEYLLLGHIFAPDREKEMFVRQLEVVLNTFQLPAE